MNWWLNPQQRPVVVSKCMDPAQMRSSAGVAALALHGAGREFLQQAASTNCPDPQDLVSALAALDVSALAVEFGKAAGADGRGWLLDAHYEAADAARRVTHTLVAKGVPVPLAVWRAAAAYGATWPHLGDFVSKMSAPAVHPLVVDDAGLKAVQRWASDATAGFELVSKERVYHSDDDFYQEVERNAEGRFVRQGNRMVLVADEGKQREKRKREGDQRQDTKVNARRRRDKRDKHLNRVMSVQQQVKQQREEANRRELERHAAAGAAMAAMAEQMRAEKPVQQKQQVQAKKTTSARKRQEKQLRDLTKLRKLQRDRMLRRKQQRLEKYKEAKAGDPGAGVNITWNDRIQPEMIGAAAARGFTAHVSEEPGDRMYVQVPLDIIMQAGLDTEERSLNTPGPGPRLSIDAANAYLESATGTQGNHPHAIKAFVRSPMDGITRRLPTIMPEATEYPYEGPVVNVPVRSVLSNKTRTPGEDWSGEVAPYLSLDITEAFDLVGALAGFLQLTNPSDWGEWYSHKAKLNDLESTTLDAVADLDAEIAQMYVHDYLVGVAAEDSHDRSDEWLKATWDQITSADIFEAMESDLQAVQAAQRGAEGAGDGYVWLENMGNVEYDENDTHNPNEELEDVYLRSGLASKLHTATTDEYLDRSNWLTWKSDVVDALHFGFPKMMYGRMFGADPGHRLGFDIADQQKELDEWRSNQQKRKDLAAEFGSRQVPPF